eukprot:s1119_g8.t1
MLRVWSASGQEFAARSMEQFENAAAVKEFLCEVHGFPVYLQQLLHEGNLLVDDDKLAGPMDVQLVLLTISDPATRLLAEDDLSKALRSNHVEMARFLLKAGVDGDRRDSNGCTALMRGI